MRLNQVTLHVSDLERSVAFYTRLGLKQINPVPTTSDVTTSTTTSTPTSATERNAGWFSTPYRDPAGRLNPPWRLPDE